MFYSGNILMIFTTVLFITLLLCSAANADTFPQTQTVSPSPDIDAFNGVNLDYSYVPEPTTIAILSLGGFLLRNRRKSKA